jgi:hypothetical protein
MGTKWYGLLLRLYPRAFRERFEEGMAQTFRDLCRERRAAGRGLAGLSLWVFFETLAGIAKENLICMAKLRSTILRVAIGALIALMVPLVASQLVEGWNWGAGSFVFVYLLFFGTGMAFALITRRMGVWSYKAGVGVALAAGFALGWSNMVHVTSLENPANLAYFSVLGVGLIGAFLARLEARGLARTLFAMAVTLGLISVMVPSGAPAETARNMVIGHVVYTVLFAGSGLLFRHASGNGIRG